MQRKLTILLCTSFLTCIIPIVNSSYHGPSFSRHAELAIRAEGNIQLFKRITGATWKYYDVEETGNAGSCGLKHINTDFTVAMNVAQMNPGWCFKTITMTQGGKTTTATISDTCMGCPYGGLDLTEGLFAFFLGHWPQGGGVLTGDWEFTDAAPTKPAAPPPVKTMKPPPPPVTSTVHNPVVSSTKSFSTASISATSKTASSTSAPNSTISSSSASMSMAINYLSGVASGLAIPTGSIDTTDSSSNLEGLNSVFVQLGCLAMAAGIN